MQRRTHRADKVSVPDGLVIRLSASCRAPVLSMARRAVTNLLSNAVRYSLPQAEIEVHVEQGADGSCAVEVSNPAAPISDEELRRLFGRFSHGDRRADPIDEGSGLGLSIVESIMRLHGGSVSAHSSGGGVRFRLVFPPMARSIS